MNLHTHTSTGEEKNFYFIAGLPRSGSTLLCNILNQNPRFHATSTSGVITMLLAIRDNWNNITEFKATRNDAARLRVLRAMFQAFYADIDKPVIFDKSRGWLRCVEMVEAMFGTKAKVLVPVRDIRDILASFEKIYREESKSGQIPQEKKYPIEFQTVEGRSEVWLKASEPLGRAHNLIRDAIRRGYADRMYFIFFDELTTKPEQVMKGIYNFLGEKPFAHDFENVAQTTHEDDFIHGFQNLHTIRPKVAPLASTWQDVLGPFAEGYKKLNFWDTYRAQP